MAKKQASIDDPKTWHRFADLNDEFLQVSYPFGPLFLAFVYSHCSDLRRR